MEDPRVLVYVDFNYEYSLSEVETEKEVSPETQSTRSVSWQRGGSWHALTPERLPVPSGGSKEKELIP